MSMATKQGILYWITGFSGAGKTALATCFYRRLKAKNKAVVLLDGDELRKAYGLADCHYEFTQRKDMAMRHARMCLLLVRQGIDVICPTISLFEEVRDWLAEKASFYTEVFIKADPETLARRQAQKHPAGTSLMVGADVSAELPITPHITLTNNGFLDPHELCDQLEFYLSQHINQRQQL